MNKKGIIFVLLSSLFFVFQLNAQDKFSLGPRVGVNFSNVSNVDNSESLTGLALGLTTTYSINESTGITVDFMYSGEGYKDGNNELRLNYLQIPIYFDLFFGELGSAFRPKVYAGFAPGILLSAKDQNDVDFKDFTNSVNLALSGGLGFNYRVANRIWLNTDLRAFLGLNDIRDKDLQQGDKITNNTYQFSLGLAYGLSKL